MSLRIYNTLTRQISDFTPIEPGHVRMYVCGMTVYDLCHLGHARSMVAFDVVQRWLKASGYKVTYVRNITPHQMLSLQFAGLAATFSVQSQHPLALKAAGLPRHRVCEGDAIGQQL